MNLKWENITYSSISKSGEHNKSYLCQKINTVHVDTTYYKGEKENDSIACFARGDKPKIQRIIFQT